MFFINAYTSFLCGALAVLLASSGHAWMVDGFGFNPAFAFPAATLCALLPVVSARINRKASRRNRRI